MKLCGLLTKFLSGADRKGNVQAGFLAEEGLKSPFNRDYFLQSHGGLLGSTAHKYRSREQNVDADHLVASRPSHYTVLRDDCFKKMPHLQVNVSVFECWVLMHLSPAGSKNCPSRFVTVTPVRLGA